jgi:hypothetical protein
MWGEGWYERGRFKGGGVALRSRYQGGSYTEGTPRWGNKRQSSSEDALRGCQELDSSIKERVPRKISQMRVQERGFQLVNLRRGVS